MAMLGVTDVTQLDAARHLAPRHASVAPGR
jgi:hypothetical protein